MPAGREYGDPPMKRMVPPIDAKDLTDVLPRMDKMKAVTDNLVTSGFCRDWSNLPRQAVGSSFQGDDKASTISVRS